MTRQDADDDDARDLSRHQKSVYQNKLNGDKVSGALFTFSLQRVIDKHDKISVRLYSSVCVSPSIRRRAATELAKPDTEYT